MTLRSIKPPCQTCANMGNRLHEGRGETRRAATFRVARFANETKTCLPEPHDLAAAFQRTATTRDRALPRAPTPPPSRRNRRRAANWPPTTRQRPIAHATPMRHDCPKVWHERSIATRAIRKLQTLPIVPCAIAHRANPPPKYMCCANMRADATQATEGNACAAREDLLGMPDKPTHAARKRRATKAHDGLAHHMRAQRGNATVGHARDATPEA